MMIASKSKILLATLGLSISPCLFANQVVDPAPFAPAKHYRKPKITIVQPERQTHTTASPYTPVAPVELQQFAPGNPELRMDTIDQNWNVFAGAGYMTALSATSNSVFHVTPDPYGERDMLSAPTQSTHIQYLLGFQRVFYKANATFQRIGFGPTLSFDPVTFSGQVYQYLDPTFANYDYRYKVYPVNLSLEAQFLLRRHGLPHHVGVAPYFLLGAGASYVDMSYNETCLCDTPTYSAYSFDNYQITPLLTGGLGLQFDIRYAFFLRTEYRYVYRGDVELRNNVFLSPVKANLDTQSINFLLGYRFA